METLKLCLCFLCFVSCAEAPNAVVVDLLQEIMTDNDVWEDADMQSVILYLRGNRHLNVPREIRTVLAMDK